MQALQGGELDTLVQYQLNTFALDLATRRWRCLQPSSQSVPAGSRWSLFHVSKQGAVQLTAFSVVDWILCGSTGFVPSPGWSSMLESFEVGELDLAASTITFQPRTLYLGSLGSATYWQDQCMLSLGNSSMACNCTADNVSLGARGTNNTLQWSLSDSSSRRLKNATTGVSCGRINSALKVHAVGHVVLTQDAHVFACMHCCGKTQVHWCRFGSTAVSRSAARSRRLPSCPSQLARWRYCRRHGSVSPHRSIRDAG
jgi:hypothetical protein